MSLFLCNNNGVAMSQKKAKEGNVVKVHYKGTLNNGTEFDCSHEREPLEFTVGQGTVIPGFEQGIVDMLTGEKKTINIPCDKAYGPRQNDMVQSVERNQIPPEMEIQVGQQLQVQTPDQQVIVVTITEIQENAVTLDANHPLAGQDLTFELELVEIVE